VKPSQAAVLRRKMLVQLIDADEVALTRLFELIPFGLQRVRPMAMPRSAGESSATRDHRQP
jgi:hypothetical protein